MAEGKGKNRPFVAGSKTPWLGSTLVIRVRIWLESQPVPPILKSSLNWTPRSASNKDEQYYRDKISF
jgi:hypothetical protein